MRLVIYISLLLFCYAGHAQQQVLYTQFMFNKQGINPAYAGNEKDTHITGIYRAQWLGLEGSPSVKHLSGSTSLADKNIGLGVNVTHISVGIESQFSIDGIYAYKIKMREGTLSGGLQLSYQYFKADFNDPRLTTLQGIEADPALPVGVRSTSNINTGIGAYYNTDYYYVGLSSPRLLAANIDDDAYLENSTLQQHFYLMGGYRYTLTDDISITGQALFKYLRSAPLDLDVNVYATYKSKYNAGLTYRLGGDASSIGESLDIILGMQINDQVFASMAYDITLSRLRQYQSGSIEVLAYYRFATKKKPDDFISPRFF